MNATGTVSHSLVVALVVALVATVGVAGTLAVTKPAERVVERVVARPELPAQPSVGDLLMAFQTVRSKESWVEGEGAGLKQCDVYSDRDPAGGRSAATWSITRCLMGVSPPHAMGTPVLDS